MKITRLRNLLTAVVCLFSGASAQAQFTGTYEQRVADGWDTAPVTFSLDEVATQLGTDAATLTAAFEAWEAGTDDMFFLTLPDGTLSADYTQGSKGGFWVTVEGIPQSWGVDNTLYRWYNTIQMGGGAFVINIGQYPGNCSADDVFTPKFVMKYNGKEATFDVTIKILAPLEVPEPATLVEAELNIVGEQEVDIAQDPRGSYDADNVWTRIGDAVAKLGISDPTILEEALGKIIYTTEFDTETVGKLATLTNVTTTTASPGFWYTDIRVNGDATGECSATGYSGGCYFFLEGFKYNATKDSLYVNCGQYPDKFKGGEEFFCNVYLVYGDKAYRIRYNFKANEVNVDPGQGLESYTKVGEMTEDVNQVYTGNWAAVKVYPDLDAICAALECETSELKMVGINLNNDLAGSDSEGNLIGAPTANYGGNWFTEDGYVVSYGSDGSRMYVEPVTFGDFSVLNCGQFPTKAAVGDEYQANIYFIAGMKYFAYTVHMTVVEPTVIEGEFVSVAQRSYIIQQTPDNSYGWSEGKDMPLTFIEEVVGKSWVVYGMELLDSEGNEREGNAKYTKNYSITETPGFWLDKDGRNSGWNDRAIFGISAGGRQNGKFNLIQFPERCHVGDTYKTKLFFVNEETCKMVTINFTYNIVEEIVEYENVGSEDIVIPVSIDDCEIDIDLTKPAEALGLTVNDLTGDYSNYLYGMNEGGTFSGGVSCADGLGFNGEGFLDMINGIVFFSIIKEGDKTLLTSYSQEEVPEDFRLDVQFCFQNEQKQYVYNAKFISKAAYENGIRDIATSHKNAGKVFDLSGRQIMKPTSGVYIVNGRKRIVK